MEQNIQLNMLDPKDLHRRDSNKTLTNFDISQSFDQSDQKSVAQQRGRGLIQCLMSEQSSEIQRLNNEIRLLKSKNEYLKQDNQLLQNQITYLLQKDQHFSTHKKKTESIEQLSKLFNLLTQSFQHQLTHKIRYLQQREQILVRKVSELSQRLTKQKRSKKKASKEAENYKLLELQIQNKRLSIRIIQLQKNINELNEKYIHTFQWKPYLIPEFTPYNLDKHRPTKLDLKLDLTKINKQPAQPNQSLFVY